MSTFRIKYGGYEYEGQTYEEVVPVMYSHRYGTDLPCLDEDSFMRRIAIEMCEWNGKNYYYHSRSALADSMIKNGLLEVID